MHALKHLVATLDPRRGHENDLEDELCPRPTSRVDECEIYRYRKQRGVNLGSWFVLEKWISGAPFKNAAGSASSDYDIACGVNAKEILEKHWDTWIIHDDWKWISERGFNSVRLPIGYYHLVAKEPSIVKGTPFANLGHVFEGAWERILNAVNDASKYGIGVLIDLHSAPGKQNGDSHSGINGAVEFYKKDNLSRTIQVLKLLAVTFSRTPNIIGIQLVNEPQDHGSLLNWYRSALDSIRAAMGPGLPLYIHDAWNTDKYASLVHDRSDFVVLDHHLYRCFTSQDHELSGDQHAAALPREEFSRYAEQTRGNLVIAEFSAALNPKSYGHRTNAGEQDRQRRAFVRAELDMFEQTCGGWWMWTYKKDGWDAGWSLRDAVRADIMPNRVGHERNSGHPDHTTARDDRCRDALSRHSQYWSTRKGKYEHMRFEVGFIQGWDDAFLFLTFELSSLSTTVSELGFTGQWLKRRVEDHISHHGKSNNVWEFGGSQFLSTIAQEKNFDLDSEFKEHGFLQGSQAAKSEFFGVQS